jgi:hypothetical protein
MGTRARPEVVKIRLVGDDCACRKGRKATMRWMWER